MGISVCVIMGGIYSYFFPIEEPKVEQAEDSKEVIDDISEIVVEHVPIENTLTDPKKNESEDFELLTQSAEPAQQAEDEFEVVQEEIVQIVSDAKKILNVDDPKPDSKTAAPDEPVSNEPSDDSSIEVIADPQVQESPEIHDTDVETGSEISSLFCGCGPYWLN